jgi:Ca2+/Na+ antiporter
MLNAIALILFLLIFAVLAYLIFSLTKKYFDQQSNARAAEIQQQRLQATLPLRLQAYERLLLLCERITIPNLVGRLRTEGASATDLRMAMLMAIKQEFEHNVTQQIYVSEKLWKILLMARDNTANTLDIVAQKLDDKATAEAFIGEMSAFLSEQGGADSIGMAQAAIRQEAASLVV